MKDRKDYYREYYQRNREKKLKQFRENYDPEKNKEYCRRYQRKNKLTKYARASFVDDFENHIKEQKYCEKDILNLHKKGWEIRTIASYKNLFISTVEKIIYTHEGKQ